MTNQPRLSPETYMAIQAFDTLGRRQHAVDKAERDLHRLVVGVPTEDMAEYVRITEEIAAKRNAYREERGL